MKRREIITLIVGAAAWPLAAHAQQPAMPVIGLLYPGSSKEFEKVTAPAFRTGLAQAGFAEGPSVTIEYRMAQGHYDRLPAFAADLVDRKVAVLAALGGLASAQAAQVASRTIPIVFVIGTDPVEAKLVASLNRPGGNITGLTLINVELAAKRLALLHELVPDVSVIALLENPSNPNPEFRVMRDAARSLGLHLNVLKASTEPDIEAAFVTLLQQRIGGLLIASDAFLASRNDLIAELAARHTIPVISPFREYVAAGGLISYGVNIEDVYRQAGIYAARVLKGENPADLPVMQPTKFQLVINLKIAKALSLEVPSKLSALADEVIE
jgi:putative ABC transport system substrate-binding protein